MVETKEQLYRLIERFKGGEPGACRECVAFFLRESKGIWHGRARAKIARNLDANDLTETDQKAILGKIFERLLNGNFSEQFEDQLNLALRLSAKDTLAAAAKGVFSSKAHVAKYCKWVYERHNRQNA